MYTRVNEPQSIGGVLDSGFRLFKAGFKKILPITYVAALIGGLWGYLVQSIMINAVNAEGQLQINFFVLGISYVLILLIVSVVFAAAIAMVHGVFMGEDLGLGQAFGIGAKRALPMFATTLVYGFIVMIGFILLVIPGVYLSVALVFAFYGVVVDRLGPLQSLKYSYSLVKGNWWRTTGVLTVIFIIAMVFYIGIGFVAAIFMGAEDTAQALLEINLLRDVIIIPLLASVISALFYCLGYTIFDDLKLRRKGTDMAERIENLG